MKLLSILLTVIFAGCNSGQNTVTIEDSLVMKDTTKRIKKAVEAIGQRTDGSNSNLLGAWTDGSSENASFEIRKDSIYYVDQFATYKYSLTGDIIKIYYPDWTFTGAINFSKDTLTIASEDGTTKYWKFIN